MPVILHKQTLTRAQITHGSHLLQQWEGTITEGITDRKGKKVTADLSPISVRVEIWNKSSDAPGKLTGGGKTDVPGEYFSSDTTTVNIDAIKEAKWSSSWCIPYDDPDEPQHGEVKMKVEVRNVAEGTPVRILVARIGEGDKPPVTRDHPYIMTGQEPELQPGLEGAKVNGNRVLLSDGSEPYVRFNKYEEHWKYEGNNFYCFSLSFGERGRWVVASERDYVDKEKDCLHMRFTVFIHRSSPVKGKMMLDQYTKYADELHKFFRGKTKYFRSYIMRGSAKDMYDWLNHFRHRYIVIHLGHAACGCYHPSHPREGGKPGGKFMDPFHRGFPADQNCCPTALEKIKEAEKALKEDEIHYSRKFRGCGHKSHVFHQLILEKTTKDGKKMYYENYPGRKERDKLLLFLEKGAAIATRADTTGPRFYFFNGGCRTILTTNFGEYLTKNNTRYYSGWTYSPHCDFGKFCYDVFNRWIKGTKEDQPKTEFETGRLLPAFVAAGSRQNRAICHPRIIDRSCNLSPRGPVVPVPDGPADDGESALV
jgi:hypothetical protein